MATLTRGIITAVHSSPGFAAEVDDERMKDTLRHLYEGYYNKIDKEVIFNTNRTWGTSTHILKGLYPDAKFIFCVRDIKWVLDSFEQAYRRAPFKQSEMLGENTKSVYDRCDTLMHPEGVVGCGYVSLKQAITGNEKNSVMLIEYDQLCANPEGMLRALYNFIGEDYFQHDFNNVAATWDEYDRDVGIPLHQVHKKVELKPRELIIPPDIVNKYSGMEVWR
jgi:sulfotransferase